jgi:hypothetical protein
MSEMTIRTTRTGMNTSTTATPFTGLGLGEAPATTSALRSQTGRVEALAEQVQLLHGIITGWTGGLGDRLAQAPWGTAQINAAAEPVAMAGTDMDGLSDGLAGLTGACHAAMLVGAEAGAKAATGAAESFQPV